MDTITPTPPSTRLPGQVATNLYASLTGGDLATAADLLDPDVVVHVPGTQPLAGVHRGLDELLAFTAAVTAATVAGSGTPSWRKTRTTCASVAPTPSPR